MNVVDSPEGAGVLTAAICVPIARLATAVNASSNGGVLLSLRDRPCDPEPRFEQEHGHEC